MLTSEYHYIKLWMQVEKKKRKSDDDDSGPKQKRRKSESQSGGGGGGSGLIEMPSLAPKNAKSLDKAHKLLAAAEKQKTAAQNSKSSKAAEQKGKPSAKSKAKASAKTASKGKRKSLLGGGAELDLVTRAEQKANEDSGEAAQRLFASLLDGMDGDDFYSDYFESRPLHVQRGKAKADSAAAAEGKDKASDKDEKKSASDSSRFFASVFSLPLLTAAISEANAKAAKAQAQIQAQMQAAAADEDVEIDIDEETAQQLEFVRDVTVESTTGETAEASGPVAAEQLSKLFSLGTSVQLFPCFALRLYG